MRLRSRSHLKMLAIAALSAGQCALAGPNDFMIVALPDTQYYSQNESGNTRFHQQTAWINAQQIALKIQHVCHLGDVCNHGWEDVQYSRAKGAMDTLKNGTVSFNMVPGNHDYWQFKDANDNVTYYTNAPKYKDNFGPAYYAGKAFYGGHSPSQMSMYTTFAGGGRTYISLGLDVNAPQAEIDWAKGVLNANPGVPVILSTHEYLGFSGRDTGLSLPLSGRNTGEQLWQKLVKSSDQIFMVLSGHNHGHNQQRSFNDFNHEVLEILADYQGYDDGNGFLRTITFDPDTGKVSMQTYSPTLGRTMQTQDDGSVPGTNGLDGAAGEIGAFHFYVDLNKRFAGGDPVKRVTWNTNGTGNWSDATKWVDTSSGLATNAPGSGLTAMTFSGTGTYTATNDLGRTLPVAINQLIFNNTAGTATLAGVATLDLVGGVSSLANATITETGAGGAVINAPVRLTANTTADIANELTVTQEIRGSRTFTKNGAGTLIFTGSGAFTTTGAINVNAGAVRLAANNAIDDQSIVNLASAGTMDDSYSASGGEGFAGLTGTGTFIGRHGLNLNLGENDASAIFAGRITAGTNGVIGATPAARQLLLKKTHTGTITLNGTLSDFAGQVQALFGNIAVSQFVNRGQASSLGLGDVNNWGDSTGAAAGANPGSDISLGDPLTATTTADEAKFQYTGPSTTTDRVFAAAGLGGTLEVTNAATNLKLSSPIRGAGQLIKSGAGTLTLLAAPSMTGSVSVASGSLLEMDTAAGELTLTSAINGPGTFVKKGTGTLILGAGGDFGSSLLLTVGEGTIRKGSTAVLGDPNILNIATGATWDNSYSGAERFGGITGSGTYMGKDGSGLNLYVNIADVSFAGKITAGLNGVVGATAADRELGYFFKTGSFKLTLTGTTSDFRNTVAVQQGTLSFNNWAMRGTNSALGVGFSSTSATPDVVLGTGSLRGTLQYTGPTVVTDRRLRFDNATANTVEITNAATSLTVGIISGTGPFTKTGAGTLILPTANTHSGGTIVAAGTLAANHVQALGTGALTVTGGAVNTAQGLATPIKLTGLSVTGGKLDLKNNKMIVAGGNEALINQQIGAGRNGGAWNGNGIVTSMSDATGPSKLTTLAVAANAHLGKSTFGGQSVGANDLLLMYTYTGDANLSGHVDIDDYFEIDSHYNDPPGSATYARGDFNYSGNIDGDDYFLIDSAFGLQGAPFSSSESFEGITAVPEPLAIAPLALSSLMLRRRRSGKA